MHGRGNQRNTAEREFRFHRFINLIPQPCKSDRRDTVATTFLLIMLALLAVDAQAEPAECSDSTLTTQSPVANEESTTSTTDISTSVDGVKISTSTDAESGINNVHHGDGDITINVANSCVETTGAGASGDAASAILATSNSDTDPKTNEGDVTIDVRSSTITTTGRYSKGVVGHHNHEGGIDIDVDDSAIKTTGEYAHGVYGYHQGTNDIDIDVRDSTITTEGRRARPIQGFHIGTGDVNIYVEDTVISTTEGEITGNEGQFAVGIRGYQARASSAGAGTGDVNITLDNVRLTTLAQPLIGYSDGLGDVTIDVRNSIIRSTNRFAYGTYGQHYGTGDTTAGDIDIDIDNTLISTVGDNAYGIYGLQDNSLAVGNVDIDVWNSPITTLGANAHGIFALHEGGHRNDKEGTFNITVHRGTVIHASGTDSSGVKIGCLVLNCRSSTGDTIHDATRVGDDGYRQQTVTVNGRVWGDEAGVYLAGGGKVVIGPSGSVGAASGIAILATGTVPEDTTDPNNVIPAMPPRLRVDLNLEGTQVADALGDNWIVNDGGETTIAVNGTVLHDGARGATGATAPNGAWNVSMRSEGVTVDRTDPDNWVITEPATGVVLDRDFSVEDFREANRPPQPPRSWRWKCLGPRHRQWRSRRW